MGIDAETTLLLYDNNGMSAPIFFWCASLYGFPEGQMKLLDGGIAHWQSCGLNTHAEPEVLFLWQGVFLS